jgi:aldehyde dehydrogenase
MIGAQASNDQLEKILSYLDIGKQEGAKVLTGGERQRKSAGAIWPAATTSSRRCSRAQQDARLPGGDLRPGGVGHDLQGRGEALEIANDTLYGLGAGVWTRDGNTPTASGRGIQAGRVWTNCYHAYPAHAAFGGYKQSGIGRENHKMMLDHYQQTKNLLVSYSPRRWASSFSLEGPEGLRFLTRSRLYTDDEARLLESQPPGTGAAAA